MKDCNIKKWYFVTGISFHAYDFVYPGVAAKKEYFMFENGMFCLGTGISAYKTEPVLFSPIRNKGCYMVIFLVYRRFLP